MLVLEEVKPSVARSGETGGETRRDSPGRRPRYGEHRRSTHCANDWPVEMAVSDTTVVEFFVSLSSWL